MAKVARMQAEWDAECARALAELPGRFGFTDLASFVRAVREAAGAKSTKKSREMDVRVVSGKKVTRSAPAKKRQRSEASTKARPVTLPSPAPAPKSGESTVKDDAPVAPKAAAVSPQAAETWPGGTSLDDPKNFGLRPDRTVLERGPMSRDAFQAKLAEALRFATQVLHTSKVPAVVWREWRSFERELQTARQTLSQTP